MDSENQRLRKEHAGGYVAWLGNEVFISAPTYDELGDRLDQTPIDQGKFIIGYIDPIDVVRIYSPRVSRAAVAIQRD
jgi:hypothetical protein